MGIIRQLGPLAGLVDSHHEMAAAKAQVQQLIDIHAGLCQYILADNADIRCPVLHIGRHISGLADNKLDLLLLIDNNQLAGLLAEILGGIARLSQEIRRNPKQLALRQGDCYIVHIVRSHGYASNFSPHIFILYFIKVLTNIILAHSPQ